MKAEMMNHKIVHLLLYDNVEILDFAGPMEVFMQAGFDVYTVGPYKTIAAMNKLKITVDYLITDSTIPRASILAIPGGDGVFEYLHDEMVMGWITQAIKTSAYNFSVCTGAYLLAQTGILDGKQATTIYTRIEDMENRYPAVKVVSGVRFVDNGKEITTAGISAGIDGALHLVAKIRGTAVAENVARRMEYDKWVKDEGLIIK